MAQPSSSSSSSSTSLSNSGRPTVRRSCNACTDAKLGCTKEKPTCARCARRGDICVYSATRRLGRRPSVRPLPGGVPSQYHKSPQSVGNTSQQELQQPQLSQRPAPTAVMSSFTPPAMRTSFSTGILPKNNALVEPMDLFASVPASAGVTTDAASTFFPDFVTSNNFTTLPSQRPGHDASSGFSESDFEQMLNYNQAVATIRQHKINDTRPLDDFETNKINRHDSMTSASSQYGNDRRSMSLSTSTGWFSTTSAPMPDVDYGNTEPVEASSSRSASSSKHPLAQTQASSVQTACDCFDSSCSLLRTLTPDSLLPRLPGTGTSDDRPTSLPSFDSVIAQNDLALDAVSKMAKCQGAHNSSPLALLSMIVFRTIGWYAAAAAAAASTVSTKAAENRSPRRTDSHCLQLVQSPTASFLGENSSGELPSNVARQLVLSKVHSTQRVVNQLCTCLQRAAADFPETRVPDTANGTAVLAQNLLLNDAMLDTISGRMMGELEASLRARLRELSQCIMISMIDE